MAGKGRRKKRKKSDLHGERIVHSAHHGTPAADVPPSELQILAYDKEKFIERTSQSIEDVKKELGHWPVVWVNVNGLADVKLIHDVGAIFKFHELALEDVLNARQRSKIDVYDDHLFIVTRMVVLEHEHPVSEQLSMFVGENFVVTFQQHTASVGMNYQSSNCLDLVRDRICKSIGQIRGEGADYLCYALIDSVVDGYFPVLDEMSEHLEGLEESMFEKADKHTPALIHDIKRDLMVIRRAIWPLREAINQLVRDRHPLIKEKSLLYLTDCYDHALRIMDLVETYRDICADVMDLHLSLVNTRMNEVIKLLTIVATIFTPPMIVVGIYGMNFHHMPELSWEWGYPWYVYGLMTFSAAVPTFLLWRWGWLTDQD